MLDARFRNDLHACDKSESQLTRRSWPSTSSGSGGRNLTVLDTSSDTIVSCSTKEATQYTIKHTLPAAEVGDMSPYPMVRNVTTEK